MTSASASAPLDRPLYGASLSQAVRRFFAKYAVFTGRASLSEYWWSVLFVAVVSLVIWVPGIILGAVTGTRSTDPTTGLAESAPGPIFIPFVIVGFLLFLAVLVPGIAVTVRRLHDANLSGLLYLLVLVPSFGSLIVLVLTLLPSSPEGARFDALSR
ncbi:MAG TPA: DUF805 domain-containing protein [Solirubrobacteraceae bacterium]|nr:DUF805 domain-containing protein [Solirubrobacteraceae bacterium]